MREIVTKKKDPNDQPERVEVKLDDEVLVGRRPKESALARAMAVFGDKHAPDTIVARAAFDFLQASLQPESFGTVLRRINDPEDGFDSDELIAVFEALLEEFQDQVAPEQPATNREARRRAPARG